MDSLINLCWITLLFTHIDIILNG